MGIELAEPIRRQRSRDCAVRRPQDDIGGLYGRRQLGRIGHHYRSRPGSEELEERAVPACGTRMRPTTQRVAVGILDPQDFRAAVGEQPGAIATRDLTGQIDHFGPAYCGCGHGRGPPSRSAFRIAPCAPHKTDAIVEFIRKGRAPQ